MRLIKMFGLAAIVSLASLAFIGASSASATFNTALCGVHTSLTCASPLSSATFNLLPAGQVAKLLSSFATVLCLGLTIEFKTENGDLASAPTPLKATAHFIAKNCGTNSTHTNCIKEETEEGLADLLKTGLNEGVVGFLAGKLHVVCKDVFGFISIDCEYDLSGFEVAAGSSHITANKAPEELIEGSSLCPEETTLDWLVGAANVYLLQ